MIRGIRSRVDMHNGELSAVLRGWLARARKEMWAVEPLLDRPIRFGRAALREGRVDSRQVRGIRLRRSHVLCGMLKRVDIDRQSVEARVSVICELPRQYFVEQSSAAFATARHSRPAFRTGDAQRTLASHLKFWASLVLPTPMYFAICG